MKYPTRESFGRYAREYNLIPVTRTLLADTETPIRVFQQFCEDPHAFLLESVEGGAKWARYSFIGTDPFLVVRGKSGTLEIERSGNVERVSEQPIDFLRGLLNSYRSPQYENFPRFMGGAVGFFGYDLLRYYEKKLPPHKVDDLKMNDVQFMFCDQLIVFDHLKQHMVVVANAHVPEGAGERELDAAYADAEARIDRAVARLHGGGGSAANAFSPRSPHGPVAIGPDDYTSNLSKEAFMGNVRKAKEYIRAGDIFQVVLSQRFEMETDVSPLHVYRVLRTMNPSPYMYYLKMGEERIVGTSPELLVRVEGGKVQTRPIAGTRPRGKTPEEDARLERELLADEKELAEHLMLVDLGRNDIGRVSVPGTVHVDAYMEVERYSHVMHIVSNVSGTMREDKDFYDAFLSCMPAGTVSGAPKLRAMEIIAELEQEARGAYAGAIGYLGFSGNLDTCITIRTIIFRGGKAYVQAGAGIVWDSVPEKEYEETVNKAKGMLTAIKTAEAIFGSTDREPVTVNQDYYSKP
ncbi:anthranilate synthase component I [Paenibacillus sp.]|uniref:anthranilate synthase component I n=1 Tax=Paenibacillus sp. TaxID=58172 RepID=UPI002D595ECF|nr:anthranilate synthase component I [Paenibacillus sp.]HZG57456.1 anthranilate synthase component I [Paenibacillus sp.]